LQRGRAMRNARVRARPLNGGSTAYMAPHGSVNHWGQCVRRGRLTAFVGPRRMWGCRGVDVNIQRARPSDSQLATTQGAWHMGGGVSCGPGARGARHVLFVGSV